ncbi:hypothetical protein AAZV13_20G182850 [Glycine max]
MGCFLLIAGRIADKAVALLRLVPNLRLVKVIRYIQSFQELETTLGLNWALLWMCHIVMIYLALTHFISIKTIVESFQVTDVPVRSAKFIARKQWNVAGADDRFIHVYNYITKDRVKRV